MLDALVGSCVGRSLAEPSLRPPSQFRPVAEIISSVRMLKGPGGFAPSKRKPTRAQRAGVYFERKAQAMLSAKLPGYEASPWFSFREATSRKGRRWCQPDGILVLPEVTVIFEIKIRTLPQAWWQLVKLYKPVVQKALSPERIALVQVLGSFDPAVPYPGRILHLDTLDVLSLRKLEAEDVYTFTWRP